jgi:hypothetical protein
MLSIEGYFLVSDRERSVHNRSGIGVVTEIVEEN